MINIVTFVHDHLKKGVKILTLMNPTESLEYEQTYNNLAFICLCVNIKNSFNGSFSTESHRAMLKKQNGNNQFVSLLVLTDEAVRYQADTDCSYKYF